MKLSIIDIDILIDLLNQEYENMFKTYKTRQDDITFSRLIDIQQLRKKLNEIKIEKRV